MGNSIALYEILYRSVWLYEHHIYPQMIMIQIQYIDKPNLHFILQDTLYPVSE